MASFYTPATPENASEVIDELHRLGYKLHFDHTTVSKPVTGFEVYEDGQYSISSGIENPFNDEVATLDELKKMTPKDVI